MPSIRNRRTDPPGMQACGTDPVLPFRDSEVLRRILDAAPMRVTYLDGRRRYRFANREFYGFTGLSPEQVIGRTVAQVLGRETALKTRSHIAAVRQGRTARFEGWRTYPTGGLRYIDSVFAPVLRADGRVDGYFVLVRDLTEQRRREEELAQRTALLETVLASVADGVSVLDRDGRLVLCNRGFLDLHGFPETLGRPGMPLDVLVRAQLARGPRDAQEVPHRATEALVAELTARVLGAGETSFPRAEEELHADGRWLEIRRRRLPDSTLVLTHTDVSARHEAERARRAQRDALRRVERLEATASLLAGVAHEVGNPLAAVAAQAQLLAEEAGGTPLAARAERVREAALRCGRIVSSLAASAQRRTHRREEVDLAQAVEAGLDLAGGYGLCAAGIALERQVPRDLPRLRGDPDQIAHLVANLVANARAALAEGPPPRRLALAVAHQEGTLELRVADNGPGIPDELRERVFAPFFTTKPEGVGTGVGLALCRAVAAAHGGTIRAEATPGGGATLVVRLPLPEGSGCGGGMAVLAEADGAE